MPGIALLSDIHGNLPALEAVVEAVADRGPDAVYVLGDMVNGCPWSEEVLDRLGALGWPLLLGNHDDAVTQLGTPRMEARYADRSRFATLWWTRRHLSDHHMRLLEELPTERVVGCPDSHFIRLVHGLPGNFFAGFRPDSSVEWSLRYLEETPEPVVVGGHTHVPMVRRVGRWLVVNTGAVGVPYDGDVRASYAWLEWATEGWRPEIVRVSYDIDVVVAGFRSSGLLLDGGVMGELFLRSVTSGLPWVADFAWWLHNAPCGQAPDVRDALRVYDRSHGPGRWAFQQATH